MYKVQKYSRTSGFNFFDQVWIQNHLLFAPSTISTPFSWKNIIEQLWILFTFLPVPMQGVQFVLSFDISTDLQSQDKLSFGTLLECLGVQKFNDKCRGFLSTTSKHSVSSLAATSDLDDTVDLFDYSSFNFSPFSVSLQLKYLTTCSSKYPALFISNSASTCTTL